MADNLEIDVLLDRTGEREGLYAWGKLDADFDGHVPADGVIVNKDIFLKNKTYRLACIKRLKDKVKSNKRGAKNHE